VAVELGSTYFLMNWLNILGGYIVNIVEINQDVVVALIVVYGRRTIYWISVQPRGGALF